MSDSRVGRNARNPIAAAADAEFKRRHGYLWTQFRAPDTANLMQMLAESDKQAKDWRDAGEVELLKQMLSAYQGLKACGWNDAIYCPKDGTRFLVIEAGSLGVFPCTYQGKWPDGLWWLEDDGDICPGRPILWKPLDKEKS